MLVDQIEMAERQAEICSVFSNPRRILILWTLADHEKSVGEIADDIEASLQNTSQHLRKMKECKILKSSRNGQTVFYRITNFAKLDRCLNSLLERCPRPK